MATLNKDAIIPFGKFKGKKLHEADRDYLEWMATLELTSNNFRESLKAYLAEPKSNAKDGDDDIDESEIPF